MRTQSSSVKKNQKIGNSIIITLFLLMIMLAILSIFGCEFLIKFLTKSTFFVLKDIKIYGNSNIKSADIFESVGLNVGADRMYSFMSHIVERRIKSYSYFVKDVKVKRDLLNGQLLINIEERKPIAIVSDSVDSPIFKVVDVDGYILEELTNRDLALSSYKDMPLILDDKTGMEEQEKPCMMSRSVTISLNILSEMQSEFPKLLSRISEIDARNPDDIILYIRNGAYIRLASDRIKDGISDAKCLFLRSNEVFYNKRIDYIDLRFIGAVYCGKT